MPHLTPVPDVDCWDVLGAAVTAHVSFWHEDEIHAMPVNIMVRDGQIWFRTRPDGVKLRAAAANVRMAVAVTPPPDGLDHLGVSATARGPSRLAEPPVGGITVRPWAPDARDGAWVCVDVDTVVGRRLAPGSSDAAQDPNAG